MTFSLALQEQYRAEYWQEKKETKLHGTVFSNKYNPLLISALLSKSQTVAVDEGRHFVQVNRQGFPK